MVFLIEEALRIADEGEHRIADEGEHPLLGAKLSDCVDCLERALAHASDAAITAGAECRT